MSTLLAQHTRPATGRCSAELVVDRADRYLFDHPLDHVPGMALICGLFDLVRSGGADGLEHTGRSATVALEMPAYCELDVPVRLEAASDGTSTTLRAEQQGQPVCTGSLLFRPHPGRREEKRPRLIEFRDLCEPHLVHRHRPENVLISEVATDTGVRTTAVRRPAAGHRLASRVGEPMRIEALLDAARQFAFLIAHVEHATPPDRHFVLHGLEADVPCGPRTDVFLRWDTAPGSRGRVRTTMYVVEGDPADEPTGRITYCYSTVGQAAYHRLRGRGAAR